MFLITFLRFFKSNFLIFATKHCNMECVTTLTLHHPFMEKVQHELVAPWKDVSGLPGQWWQNNRDWQTLFDGLKGEAATIQLLCRAKFCMVTIYCLCCVLWQWIHTICWSVTTQCASVHITYCFGVCLCVFSCVGEWACYSVSVVTVENTNLASTSNAVCHVGAALLRAPLTLWTSQHFSLFTVAHAKPPLHLKSLHHVVNSLPKGNLHFFPLLGIQPVRNTKEENCFASGATVSDSVTLLFVFFAENWQTSRGFQSLFADFVCGCGCVCAAWAVDVRWRKTAAIVVWA